MPIVEVEDQRFEFPEGTPDEVIGQAIRSHFAETQPTALPAEPQLDEALALPGQPAEAEEPAETTFKQDVNQAILDAPGGPAIIEFTSAVNRGAVNLLDFITTEQINNVLQLTGSETRVPKIGEIAEGAIVGETMEPGLARQAVRTAGEFVAPVGVTGQVVRTLASQVPKIAPTVTQRVIQSAAAKPLPETAGAVTAGAGSEVGAEVGEAIGGERGREIGRVVGMIGGPIGATLVKDSAKLLVSNSAKKFLKEAAPTTEGLKQAAREIYNELGASNVHIRNGGFRSLARSIESTARNKGFDSQIHPKVAAGLRRLGEAAKTGDDINLSELDILRRVMGAAAKSVEPDEARLGSLLVNKIDDFLDDAGSSVLTKTSKDIGAKYKDARQLWRRVKKAEQIEEAFSKAALQGTGFENGIRVQFRSILNNKKARRGFTKNELDAMRQVVKGTTLQNTAKLLGRFGFGEGQASNMLMGTIGVAGGHQVAGVTGAVVVPLVGSLSRKLAQRLTREGAKGADLIVRAGKNGLAVTKAYLKLTKPNERTSQELTELLLRPDISLEALKKAAKTMTKPRKKLIDDAVFLTAAIKASQEEEK